MARIAQRTNGNHGAGVESIAGVSIPTDGRVDPIGGGVDSVPVERIDPAATGSGASGNTEGKRGRGRPPGSKTAVSAGVPTVEILAGTFEGIHELVAKFTGIEELSIDEDEARKIAKALINLQKYYPSVDVAGVYLAWFNLAGALGAVYGPRVTTYQLRKGNEAREAARGPRPVPGPVNEAAYGRP